MLTDEQINRLDLEYFDNEYGYFRDAKTFFVSLRNNPNNQDIELSDVEDYLRHNLTHSTHKQAIHRFHREPYYVKHGYTLETKLFLFFFLFIFLELIECLN